MLKMVAGSKKTAYIRTFLRPATRESGTLNYEDTYTRMHNERPTEHRNYSVVQQ